MSKQENHSGEGKPARNIRDALSAAKNVAEESVEELEETLPDEVYDVEYDDEEFEESEDTLAAFSDETEEDVENLFSAVMEKNAPKEEPVSEGVVAVAAAVPATDPSRTTYEAALSAVANDAIAKKQRTLKYRLKKNKASYIMMAPYFIL
ncbi:MAG: hypothetical protein IKN79_03410, partial [Eubacterium sp.]|nr:hypothetical protein [Eubacterium sp.]